MILLPEQIVSAVALELSEAEAKSPKKSTKTVISSVNVQLSATASTFILSPLLNSPGTPPSPAVAVTVLEGPAAPKGMSFTKNLYVSAPKGAEIVIKSPEQKELSSTPVCKDASKLAFGFIVIIFESVLAHDIGSSKIPFPLVS